MHSMRTFIWAPLTSGIIMINISSDNIVFGVVMYVFMVMHVTMLQKFHTAQSQNATSQSLVDMAWAISSSELTMGLNFKNHIKFTIKKDYHLF